MLRLWPSSAAGEVTDDDVAHTLSTLDRQPLPTRPWLMTNMVHSLDGAASRTGRSGGLGGDGDRRMFGLIRRLPDAVLVGAGTVRAERYGPLITPARNGRPAQLVIVSARLDLDPSIPCLADSDAQHRPLIITVEAADPARREVLEPWADLVDAGEASIEADALPALLAGRGHQVVLCEGGPTLLGQLLEPGLVDEWFVTVAGLAIGGPAHRITNSATEVEERLRLRTVFTEGPDLFLSYVRENDPDVEPEA
jgi:riboflavin biosynthesis pyrimidine reductase